MDTIVLLPFVLQPLIMIVDEFYFHRRRGLGRWERIGHPVDTLSLLLCWIWILTTVSNEDAKKIYLILSFFSCACITKDEWIHQKECKGAENWLHSLLFILHPIGLFTGYKIWVEMSKGNTLLTQLFTLYTGTTFAFLLYQIVYWNFTKLWKQKQLKLKEI